MDNVIKIIRDFKGPVLISMLVNEDVIYVQAIKKDLIEQLKKSSEDCVTASERDGFLYVEPSN
mgnify:CR=1 FL=1